MVGLAVDAMVGIASGRAGRKLSSSRRAKRALDRLAALIFVGLAIRLIAERR